MKQASGTSLLCACVLLLSLAADTSGQAGKSAKNGPAEVNVVLRISRTLVNELTTKKLQRTDPVYFCVEDQPITGLAHTDATFSVQFDQPGKDTAFVLQLRGATTSETTAERGPVTVHGSAVLEFTVRKPVSFDGLKLTAQATDIESRFYSTVDSIATPPGLIGLLIELIATPKIRRQQPLAAEIAYANGKAKLRAAFDQEAKKLVDELNQVSPLEETVNRLFPATKEWIYYLGTTPTHLVIGTGPPGRKLPVLPVTEKTQAPIELWIRNKPETQALLTVMKLWKDAGKQLESLLPPKVSKAIKPGVGPRTETVGEWFVIQVGTGAVPAPMEEPAPPPSVQWRPLDPARLRELDRAPDPGPVIIWRPATPIAEVFPAGHDGKDPRGPAQPERP
jgi:hypothetical protein